MNCLKVTGAGLLLVGVCTCLAQEPRYFPLVAGGRAAAAFEANTNAIAVSDFALFNKHLKEVTGAELPVGTGGAARRIAVRIEKPSDPARRFDWRVEFPSDDRMVVTATKVSLYAALGWMIEEGCDARFLGTERCMFQFVPRKDVAVEIRPRQSAPHSYNLCRTIFRVPGYIRELGLEEDREFVYQHGIPKYPFPKDKYEKEGWPEAVMPTLPDGTKLKKFPYKSLFAGWQPCYSSPEAARIAIENVREYLQKHPEEKSISLGVNDVRGYCCCTNCRAMNKDAEPSVFSNNRMNCSPSYYTFVKRVAEMVEREFPDVRIGLLAYTGTIMPPPFDLPKNVVPVMTFDIFAAAPHPDVIAAQEDVIRRWGEKVRETGTWTYGWGRAYNVPRVAPLAQAHRHKFLYEHGGRAYFGERMADALDGPKAYLDSKILADVDADPQKLLDEWYLRYAGPEAEKPLRELYRECEAFWSSPRMRKGTLWAQGGYIYVIPNEARQQAELASLTPGFTQKLLGLAREVVAKADTPAGRRRAEILVRNFEYLDCRALFQGGAYGDSWTIWSNSPEPAAVMLNELVDRADEIMAQWRRALDYFDHPDFDQKNVYSSLSRDPVKPMTDMILNANRFAANPAVAAALKRLSDCKALPPAVSKIAKCLNEEGPGIFCNPGFAAPLDGLSIFSPAPYELDETVLCGTNRTIAVRPGEPKGKPNPHDTTSNVTAFEFTQGVEPGLYLAEVKVRADKPGRKADLGFWQVNANGTLRETSRYMPTKLPWGKWVRLRHLRLFGEQAAAGRFCIRFNGFEPGETAHIGDVRLVKVADCPLTNHKGFFAGGKIAGRGASRYAVVRNEMALVHTNDLKAVDSIGHVFITVPYMRADEKIDFVLRAGLTEGAREGRIGVIVSGMKNGKREFAARCLWGQELSAKGFEDYRFSVSGKELGAHPGKIMVLFRKLPKTGGVALSSLSWDLGRRADVSAAVDAGEIAPDE